MFVMSVGGLATGGWRQGSWEEEVFNVCVALYHLHVDIYNTSAADGGSLVLEHVVTYVTGK